MTSCFHAVPFIRRGVGFLLLLTMMLTLGACGEQGPSAEESLQRARDFAAKGDERAAVIELKNALQKDSRNADARLMLGQAYVSLGNGPGALKELEQARQLGKSEAVVVPLIARALLLQGEFQRVLDELATLEGGDDNPSVLVLRGNAQLGLGNVDSARELFEKALKIDKGNIEARRGLARIGLGTGDREAAAEQIQQALDSSSEDLPTWLLKGELELSLGQNEEAERSFQRALSIDAESRSATVGLIRALLAQQKTDAAAKYLEPLHKALPDDAMVSFLYAILSQQRNDTDETQSALRDVLRVAPNHGPSQLILAAIHYTKREFAQAEDLVTRFLANQKTHVQGRKLLGAIYLETRRPQQAIDLLEPMIASQDKDAQLLALLGTGYLNVGQTDKGTEYLERASKLAPDVAAIRTQLALSLLASGAGDAAIGELQAAVSSDPNFARADLLLILAHIQKQEFEQALEAAKALAEKQPDSPVPLNLVGAAYEGMGDTASARQAYEKALEQAPKFTAAAMNLARLDLQVDELESARKRLNDVLAIDPAHAGALVMLARIANSEGKVEDGIKLLERARESNEKALEPRLILGAFYQRQGDRKNALAMAREAAAIAPGNANALLLLGRALVANGEGREATQTFQTLVKQYPDSANAHYHLAMAQAQANDIEATRASLKRALELDGRHLLAKATLGELELRAGNADEALKLARELRTDFPQAPAGFVLEGDVHLAAGRPQQAIENYRNALAISPNGAIVIKIANTQRAAGDAAAATATLEQWLSEHPDDLQVRLMFASEQQQKGSDDESIANYEAVLKEQPQNVLALNNLAWLYFQRGDSRALDLAQRAYKQLPDRAEIIDTYGWLLVQGGNTERGLTLLERAVRLAPSNLEIRFHLAAALAKAGDTERARSELRGLLEAGGTFNGIEEARKLLQNL